MGKSLYILHTSFLPFLRSTLLGAVLAHLAWAVALPATYTAQLIDGTATLKVTGTFPLRFQPLHYIRFS